MCGVEVWGQGLGTTALVGRCANISILSLNMYKTKKAPRRPPPSANQGSSAETARTIKFLGLYITTKLIHSLSITSVGKKAQQCFLFLWRLGRTRYRRSFENINMFCSTLKKQQLLEMNSLSQLGLQTVNKWFHLSTSFPAATKNLSDTIISLAVRALNALTRTSVTGRKIELLREEQLTIITRCQSCTTACALQHI